MNMQDIGLKIWYPQICHHNCSPFVPFKLPDFEFSPHFWTNHDKPTSSLATYSTKYASINILDHTSHTRWAPYFGTAMRDGESNVFRQAMENKCHPGMHVLKNLTHTSTCSPTLQVSPIRPVKSQYAQKNIIWYSHSPVDISWHSKTQDAQKKNSRKSERHGWPTLSAFHLDDFSGKREYTSGTDHYPKVREYLHKSSSKGIYQNPKVQICKSTHRDQKDTPSDPMRRQKSDDVPPRRLGSIGRPREEPVIRGRKHRSLHAFQVSRTEPRVTIHHYALRHHKKVS